ncbi:DUF7331 family protein [Candidatus Halobonum tyrrellensis]|uniref:Uncharacterized protein n=1 Tax=Candidatus Halobonum tyrrellensis G22 TaxID=1324957 RepID=V4HCH9_9EURY|nr:hypothetical protein [Candidatus Halobonum tyrrellensis]ESP88390.1 hypothetical protein K933_09712 [Candidatus Halobonum tyrrellensis G22]
MTHPSDLSWDGTDTAERSDEAVETVESYEDEGRVVLYDAENPLAWVEADGAVPVTDIS